MRYLVWTPGHQGLPGNEAANSDVHTLIYQEPGNFLGDLKPDSYPVLSFKDISAQYRGNYGFMGKMRELSTSYLTDRSQHVTIGDFISDPPTVLTGIPQGSVLGPILFSLHINDFPSVWKHSQALMFADDLALIFTGATIDEIQPKINPDFGSVVAWLSNSYLSLNLDKTKYIIFHSRRKQLGSNWLPISLNNKQTRLLGCLDLLAQQALVQHA